MRKKKLILNTVTSLINQVVTIICGFVLPRMILINYGSEVNGLVSSIQQFLAVITFLEFGVGAVVQSALYKPLAQKDNEQISKIISSANKFFRTLAKGMLVYVLFLLILYPLIVNDSFGILYTDTLILAMSISYFAQYFFGLKNQLLVIADQRGYIHYGLNTIAIVLNNILGVLLIVLGFDIQFVKLTTSIILLLRPIFLELYVHRNYQIDKKIKYKDEPITQKWNGVAQHIATVILNSTDTVVLTLFSTLSAVSIYNVYYLVVNGLRNLVISLCNGPQALIGNLLANKESSLLNKVFNVYESIFHMSVTFVYGCASVLIVPFVQVYTLGVSDIDYKVPMFGYLICFANMAYCFRMPYNSIVNAAGHYKQTQNSAWMEMIINIVISVLLVIKFGLIGVAVGTLIAMLYRTFYMVWYLSKEIMYRRTIYFIKHFIIDIICVILMLICSKFFILSQITFYGWILLAVKLSIINLIICITCNFLMFRKELINYKLIVNKKPENKKLS